MENTCREEHIFGKVAGPQPAILSKKMNSFNWFVYILGAAPSE